MKINQRKGRILIPFNYNIVADLGEIQNLTVQAAGIGNNLNQIAMKAHALGAIDAKHYDDSLRMFEEAVQKILSAVLDPVPMER